MVIKSMITMKNGCILLSKLINSDKIILENKGNEKIFLSSVMRIDPLAYFRDVAFVQLYLLKR